MRRLAVALLAVVAIALARAATATEDPLAIVPLESVTFDGTFVTPLRPSLADGRPVAVHGLLRLPAQGERLPAVILLHGCGGIGTSETEWARHLRDAGYATLAVNSFTGRGIAAVCRGTSQLPVASVIVDLYRALDVLRAHPRIDPARIAVLGFSLGGSAALWSGQRRFAERYARGPQRFAAHLAIYPGSCVVRLEDESDVERVPIRVFHGRLDDWTPVAACDDYVARLRSAGHDALLLAYDGALHGFDSPTLPARREVPGILNFGACAFVEQHGRVVDEAGRPADTSAPCLRRTGTVGYAPATHRQALADVERALQEALRAR